MFLLAAFVLLLAINVLQWQRSVGSWQERWHDDGIDPAMVVAPGLPEVRPLRWLLTGLALSFLALFLVIPLVAMYVQGMARGVGVYWAAISDPAALARALAVQPRLLLLDEPFGSLDAKVRQELRRWLKRLHDEIDVTSVFVTHDQEEALEVADQLVVMNAGRVEQIGTPEEVYEHPATPFVYEFLGSVNLFYRRVEGNKIHLGEFSTEWSQSSQEHALAAVAYVRPHLLDIDHQPDGRPQFLASITHIHAAGSVVKVELTMPAGALVHVEMPQQRYQSLQLHKGAQVVVTVKGLKVFTNAHNPIT